MRESLSPTHRDISQYLSPLLDRSVRSQVHTYLTGTKCVLTVGQCVARDVWEREHTIPPHTRESAEGMLPPAVSPHPVIEKLKATLMWDIWSPTEYKWIVFVVLCGGGGGKEGGGEKAFMKMSRLFLTPVWRGKRFSLLECPLFFPLLVFHPLSLSPSFHLSSPRSLAAPLPLPVCCFACAPLL